VALAQGLVADEQALHAGDSLTKRRDGREHRHQMMHTLPCCSAVDVDQNSHRCSAVGADVASGQDMGNLVLDVEALLEVAAVSWTVIRDALCQT